MIDYLRAVDQRLTAPARLVIIGGAAVSLCWDQRHATSDVDLWNDPGPAFWAAVDACRSLPGAVPVSKVSVASPPINFEDRLVAAPIEGLAAMQVFVPEAHDLALMKTVRAEAHDLDAVEDMHRLQPLSLSTLVERYRETLPTHIGPDWRLKGHFLALVARLFGEAEADRLSESL